MKDEVLPSALQLQSSCKCFIRFVCFWRLYCVCIDKFTSVKAKKN